MSLSPYVFSMLSNFSVDLKAEILAASIQESKPDAPPVLILPKGALKRSVSPDILNIHQEQSQDYTEYTVIDTSREGLYDMLPQGLFHQPAIHKSLQSEKETLEQMKKRKKEEMDARLFFIPFEAAINMMRTEMAALENRFCLQSHYDELGKILSPYWKIFELLDSRQSDIFLHLLPAIREARANFQMMEAILNMLFQVPLKLELRRAYSIKMDPPADSLLAESRLGIDLTAGKIRMEEEEDELKLGIGPTDRNTLQSFMNGGRNRRILDYLCDYLVPVETPISITVELVTEHRQARLHDMYQEANCHLGEDMILSN